MRVYIVGCGVSLAVLGCGEVKSSGDIDASNEVLDAGTIDASDMGSDAGPSCPVGAICEENVNYAFVTSTKKPPSEFGGLAGADTMCNDLALAADLPGQYVAWLSSTTEDARDRLGSASGWIRSDGRPFVLSRGGLISSQIIHPLNLDENGVTRNVDVMATNTFGDGTGNQTSKGDACNDWAGGDVYEAGRSSGLTNDWTASGDELSCIDDAHIYCFGISNDNAIQLPETTGLRRAWISTGVLAGNLGRAVMDAVCASEAEALGVASALAFVATTTESAVDRLDLTGPTWVRPDNAALWLEAIDITSKPPFAAINLSNQGDRLDGSVWTGAETPTTMALPENNCQDWASGSDRGLIGVPSNLLEYFSRTTVICTGQTHFYCFEE